MKRHYTYYWNICFSLLLQSVEIESNFKREGKPKDADTDSRMTVILTFFLTYVVIPYSEPYVFASLTRVSQPTSTICLLGPLIVRTLVIGSSNFLTARPTDWLTVTDQASAWQQRSFRCFTVPLILWQTVPCFWSHPKSYEIKWVMTCFQKSPQCTK